MKRFQVFIFFLLVPFMSKAQDSSTASISLIRSYFPEFQFHQNHVSNISSYTIKLIYYDSDYSRLEYAGDIKWKFYDTITFSYGLSAAYVVPLSRQFLVKPGFRLGRFKTKDHNCKFFILMMNDCGDDSHTSWTPFVETEIKVVRNLSFVVQTEYTGFHSLAKSVKEPDPSSTERKHSIYGAGFGFGVGLKINF